MLMTPIEPPLPSGSYLVVRLLRRWCAAGTAGDARLPSIVRLAGCLGVTTEAAVAIASMFQLTEACLGRQLEPECCCSARLSRDERAVLMMLAAATLAHRDGANSVIPHGLPGALLWALKSVRRYLDDAGRPSLPAAPKGCPFDHHSTNGLTF